MIRLAPFLDSVFQLDYFFDAFGCKGFEQPSADAAFHRIEQPFPVFQRRILDNLPRLRPAFTGMKNPAVATLVDINFHALAVVGSPLPADVPAGHS